MDVRNPANTTIVANGIQSMPLGQLAEFEIRTDTTDADFDVTVRCESCLDDIWIIYLLISLISFFFLLT